MSDLINRQAAIDALIEWYGCEPNDIEWFKEIIEAKPSAEPNIVRCKDCKYYEEYKNGEYRCWKMILDPAKPTDFCSMGERREDETD